VDLKALKMALSKRLIAQGQWEEASIVKDRLIREARERGLQREDAHLEAYQILDELFPPTETSPGPATPPQETTREVGEVVGGEANPTATAERQSAQTAASARDESAVTGLSDIPADWNHLPANAPLAAEVQWVQANRLSVVRTVGETSVVDLSKSLSPAPSWAALGWLETSIRAYAKYVDVAAKASATLEDEREMIRRERLAIDEVRSLLAEMLEG
jgi:hypothetical protein